MFLAEDDIHHVFNRGINREVIFKRRQNYFYFIDGVRKYLLPYCDILAWTLMPNHFHFLIRANKFSVPLVLDRSFPRQQFSQGVKQLLSSYAKAINKQEGRTGNLFQQKTKSRLVNDPWENYSSIAFHYIHQNPVKAGLTDRMEDWEFSSFQEYLGRSEFNLCNVELTCSLLDLDRETFLEDSYKIQSFSYTCQV